MTQRPEKRRRKNKKKSKTGISTKTSEFIKRKKRTILKRYTNCTVTSITTGRKRRRRMMIWCGDNVEKMRTQRPQRVTQEQQKERRTKKPTQILACGGVT